MDSPAPPPHPGTIADGELHALVDGRLPPAHAAALEARIAQDPSASRTLRAWRAQRDALRALHAPLLQAEVPAALHAAASGGDRARARQAQWLRWSGMAASVALAFCAGWLVRGGMAPAARPVATFAHQAMVAHAAFAPEVRHPVEVPAAQQEHLVQWLSKRLGHPLHVPDLDAQGYTLVGGRLLPGDAGARAQFMFQNAQGLRLTLYIGAVGGASATPRETAFRFTDEGPVPGFYWVNAGFGYALVGPLPRSDLLRLAQAVYAQL
ncbi:anti-sigma factor [Ramlibacter sp. H39-3-26]|uniref:anti-sigma factor family protein n=1 Tax=Curvibacter soli TaxID=3031331 RepID=UPI0023D98172|nr:anti-sigma factor [Ramlibacter sp. H39-3-26]MDF1486598.1 anti-sigma factor [Ramlibacter sp. H39-3-26]